MQFDTTDQRLAHLPEHRPHQRLQPVLRVHVPRRLGLQPGVAQPDAASTTPTTGFDVEASAHALRRRDHGAGDHRRLRQLPDAERSSENSHDFRPLGLGYANLGALLMARGLPYDSDDGRDYAARDHRRSCPARPTRSRRASPRPWGRSPATRPTASRCCGVIASTASAVQQIDAAPRAGGPARRPPSSRGTRRSPSASEHGYRNSQVTVLAPTGTIAFMMDCDTTGIEPDIALVKYKKLVGGGMLKIVNHTVPTALKRLGYDEEQISAIVEYIDENDTIEGAPHLKRRAPAGLRLRLQAGQGHALHPLHGPHQDDGGGPAVPLRRDLQDGQHARPTPTAEDIEQAYLEAWKLGLKAVAIYRDGCKRTQPLSTKKDEKDSRRPSRRRSSERRAVRRKLPDERAGDHPQVLDQRPRGLHHRRHLRGRHSRARSSW